MASSSWFSFLVVPAASPTPGDSPVAMTAVVSTSPTLTTALPPEVIAGTSFGQAIVASPSQAIPSPIRAAPSPTRAVAPVSTCSGRKRSREEERSSPGKRFCNGKELLRTRLEIPPLR